MIVRAYRDQDEIEIVDLLNLSFPGGWGTLETWRRRHSHRPQFDPRDVTVAEDGGRMVGCLHTARCELSLGRNIRVPAAIDGDLAVHPQFRTRGVAEALYRFSAESLARRGVLVRQGYSESRVRGHFYTRVLGYTTVFDSTEAWVKHLDPDAAAARIESRLNAAPIHSEPEAGPVLEIAFTDLPPVQFQLGPKGASRVGGRRADLAVQAPQAILSLFSESSTGKLRRLFTELTCGRLRVRVLTIGAALCVLRLIRYGVLFRTR